jgi:hypothetical protein
MGLSGLFAASIVFDAVPHSPSSPQLVERDERSGWGRGQIRIDSPAQIRRASRGF